MSLESLDAILSPRSIAVIGATPRKGTIGDQLLDNIIRYGFNGMVFPVNPNYPFIKSIKCYPSVSAIPDDIDLAIIIVPKQYVLAVAEECGEKGVKGLVIISAGFREVGGDGEVREQQLRALIDRYGFRVVGPNCMGVINAKPDVRMNAAFAPLEPASGSLAFMTQSGALGVAILLAVSELNLGLSYFVSVGNKVDVGGNDLLDYWGQDDATKIIALYLESFGDPRRFTKLSKQITKHKPVIVVKSGRTAAGALAASSHTGHLAGLEIAVDALFHQCGVLRVGTITEMIDVVLAFTKNPLPAGDRVAIVTNAGGPGIMATDALIGESLQMSTLSDKTVKTLRAFLPAEASVRNPIDMIAGAGPEDYGRALDVVLADDAVDAVITIFVPPIMIEPSRVVQQIADATRHHTKPVFSVLMAEDRYFREIAVQVPDAPPTYKFPESAVRALSAMNRQRLWRERDDGKVKAFKPIDSGARDIIDKAMANGGGYLPAEDVNRILEAYGFPVCKMVQVPLDGDVVAAADGIGYPVVLKVFGHDIVHKSDIGGVATDITDAESLYNQRDDMVKKIKAAGAWDAVDGFLVQQMAQPGKEIILGVTTDPKFGPLLMFGMGGKYVEVIKDITFRVMPVTDIDAREMVQGIRSYPLLEGVRGEPAVDIEFIIESIQRLAQLVSDAPGIVELDMNPVIVNPPGEESRVVDARIRVDAS